MNDVNGFAIVHGMQSVGDQTGSSTGDIIKAFEIISEKVATLPNGPKKEMAQTIVPGLKEEAKKGDKADESKVNEWMGFLAKTAPDAFDVAVATFVNSILGLGIAFKKIAEKAKKDIGAK